MTKTKEKIDGLRDPDGGLSLSSIKRIIPYGDNFLFVSRVIALMDREISAEYFVDPKLSFYDSHFVGFPIMPGALITEGFAQAGIVLIRYNLENHETKDILIGKVEEARFFQPSFPGETLRYDIHLKKLGSQAARIEGTVHKDEKKLAWFSLILRIIERAKLMELHGKPSSP